MFKNWENLLKTLSIIEEEKKIGSVTFWKNFHKFCENF